jgi:hypothetical protein
MLLKTASAGHFFLLQALNICEKEKFDETYAIKIGQNVVENGSK